MCELAPLLEGEHDFSAFAASDDADALGRSKVRRVFSSRLEPCGQRLHYAVEGSGFLKHMVRNMVGTLIEGGKGNLDRDGMLRLLEPGCSGKAGPTVPACGLFLLRVDYGEPTTMPDPGAAG
jgi:tRNA pseudouridine38-40 synthase